MGGCIDWSALPLLCELHAVPDIEGTVAQLILIRDNTRAEP